MNMQNPMLGAMDHQPEQSHAFPPMPPMPAMPNAGAKAGMPGMPGMPGGDQGSGIPGQGAGGVPHGHGLPGLEGAMALLDNLVQNLNGKGRGDLQGAGAAGQADSLAMPSLSPRIPTLHCGPAHSMRMHFNPAGAGLAPGSSGLGGGAGAAGFGAGGGGMPVMPDMDALMASMGRSMGSMGQAPGFAGAGSGAFGGSAMAVQSWQGPAGAEARMEMMRGLAPAARA